MKEGWEGRSELSAVSDGDLGGTLAAAGTLLLHASDDVEALDHLAKHNMLAVQPKDRKR